MNEYLFFLSSFDRGLIQCIVVFYIRLFWARCDARCWGHKHISDVAPSQKELMSYRESEAWGVMVGDRCPGAGREV